jgi:transcriptional regulator with XRE-family HTH domain
MRFCDKLKLLRHNKGLTQEGLADLAGLPVATLRAHEQGQRSPSWAAVVRLARALGETSAAFDDCDEVRPEHARKGKRRKKA